MNSLLYQFAQYNLWAHQRLTACILALDSEQQHKEIASSFDSLYKTVTHVWFATTAWWNRLHYLPAPASGDPFNASMKELSEALLMLDENFVLWVESRDEVSIAEQFTYRNFRGQEYTEPANEILMHIFNHGTYHNGQIVTMLHYAGADSIPATDFIEWHRQTNKKS